MEKSRLMKNEKSGEKIQYYRNVTFSTLHSECGEILKKSPGAHTSGLS